MTDTHIDKHRKRDRHEQDGRELWGNNKQKNEDKGDKELRQGRWRVRKRKYKELRGEK